jgi:hypothetical protein
MTVNFDSHPADPSLSHLGTGAVALSFAAALLTGLLLLAQNSPDSTPPPAARGQPDALPRNQSPPRLDTGVDSQRAKRMPHADGESVVVHGH